MSTDDWHGTPGGVMRHWRAGEGSCEACLAVKRREAKGAAVDRERGTPRMVALGEAAHTIIAATPRDQLSRATGIGVHKLCRLNSSGPDQKVYRRTRDKILVAGRLDFWTPIGVQRRLHALHTLGWSMRALAEEMDANASNLLDLVRREELRFVRREFADRIIATYDRLAEVHRDGAGATRAKNLAAARGWAAPAAWDDIDHDAAPAAGAAVDLDQVVVERLLAGRSTPSTRAEKVEAMRRWLATGRSEASLCKTHGWQPSRYVERQDGAA